LKQYDGKILSVKIGARQREHVLVVHANLTPQKRPVYTVLQYICLKQNNLSSQRYTNHINLITQPTRQNSELGNRGIDFAPPM